LRAEQAGIAPAVLPLLWMTLHFSKVFFSLSAAICRTESAEKIDFCRLDCYTRSFTPVSLLLIRRGRRGFYSSFTAFISV
jgi:hypothetical protein